MTFLPPDQIAAEIAETLKRDPVAAAQVKNHIAATELAQLLDLGTLVRNNGELLDELRAQLDQHNIPDNVAKALLAVLDDYLLP